MLGKLIGVGLVVGAAFFLLGPFDIGPDLSSVIDRTVNDESGKNLETTSEPTKSEPKPVIEERHTGQVFEKTDDDCLISIPDKARTINGKKELTYILPIDDCEYDVNEYVEVVFGGELVSDPPADDNTIGSSDTTNNNPETDDTTDTTSDNTIIDDDNSSSFSNDGTNITIEPHPDVQTFDKLSLTTQREGNDVVFQYYDTSGDTLSVTVVLRNAEGEIFSGTFKSAKFETSVQDVSEDTSHIIDVVIEHALYGKLYSSVYNPPGENDNTINGIFQKQ